jgi:purine-binding chemotaxis protein CheW
MSPAPIWAGSTTHTTPSDLVQLAAFCVGEETYAVDIMRVREVMRAVALTPVRQGPAAISGLLNLRGVLMPVMDLRQRFGLPPANNARRRIVVVIVAGRHVGLLVDGAIDVLRVQRKDLRPAPPMLGPQVAPFFSGACQVQQTTVLLLNLHHVLQTMPAALAQAPGDVP